MPYPQEVSSSPVRIDTASFDTERASESKSCRIPRQIIAFARIQWKSIPMIPIEGPEKHRRLSLLWHTAPPAPADRALSQCISR
jgi:hypothetical protein